MQSMRGFERSLPMALLRAREGIMSRFRPILRRHGVSEQQWRILRALMEVHEVEFHELAARCILHKPSLSRIANSLEERGLIARRSPDGDLRRTFLWITDDGKSFVDSVAPESEVAYEEISNLIGQEDLDELYALLKRLHTRLDNRSERNSDRTAEERQTETDTRIAVEVSR